MVTINFFEKTIAINFTRSRNVLGRGDLTLSDVAVEIGWWLSGFLGGL
jgi:hypothetical protein